MSNNLKVLQFWVFIISDYICKLNNSLSDKVWVKCFKFLLRGGKSGYFRNIYTLYFVRK